MAPGGSMERVCTRTPTGLALGMRHLATLLVVPAFAWSLLGVPNCPVNGPGAASEVPAPHHGSGAHAHHHGGEETSSEGPGAEHPDDHCDTSLHCVSPAHAGSGAGTLSGHAPSAGGVDRSVTLYRSPLAFADAPPPRPTA
jgi:hypothetical protein